MLTDPVRLRECGYNSRLDPMQAAILSARLPMLTTFNAHRNALADMYAGHLADCKAVRVVRGGNCHIVAVRTKRRSALSRHLSEHGVATKIHYQQPAHRQGIRSAVEPVPMTETDAWCEETLSLPLWNYATKEDVRAVTSAIREFFR
jgi:dTDP-4-amino-4,6-dideoxygalactose transaminase